MSKTTVARRVARPKNQRQKFALPTRHHVATAALLHSAPEATKERYLRGLLSLKIPRSNQRLALLGELFQTIGLLLSTSNGGDHYDA
jgi:hypothetical protein